MPVQEGPGPEPGAPRHERPPKTPQQIETWVDQTIRQAQRRGDFDDLPGAGKPLTSLDRPDDPDWWIKDLIQREKIDLSAALPGPMALRRERETYPESLLHLPDEFAVRTVLEDFNARVIADRKRPYAGQGSPAIVGRVDVDQMIGRWRALRTAATDAFDADSVVQGSGAEPVGRSRAARRRRWWRGLRSP